MQQGGGSPFSGPPPSELATPFPAAPELAAPISARLPLAGIGFDELGLQAVEEEQALVGAKVGGGSPGNRWPRQETTALLKIRSDMDAVFRDATLKGPLWEEVSRKLRELGYHRSAKKCKEKFENVYKYYKRTKEARVGRQDAKSYRFFSQLEALRSSSSSSSAAALADIAAPVAQPSPIFTSSATMVNIASSVVATTSLTPPPPPITTPMTAPAPIDADGRLISSSSNTSTYSGTQSEDEEEEEGGGARPKRKREGGGGDGAASKDRSGKMMAFFEDLIQQVMDRQEAMLQKFLEAIERREQDRMIREEAWRRQEKSRITREHELAVQERAAAASRDDAIIAFLQKLTGQKIPMPPPPQAPQTTVPTPAAETTTSPPPSQPQQAPPPLTSTKIVAVIPEPQLMQDPEAPPQAAGTVGSTGAMEPLSSRWPKSEVNALIKLRSGMEGRYMESGPKGPLWEEISAGMRRLGYNRSSKRCKEKWENINKYYKKVKESNKKRPEDAKTCPYFHQLEALYRSKLVGTSAHHGPPELESNPHHPAAQDVSTDHLAIMAPPLRQNVDASNQDGRGSNGGFPLGFFEQGSSSAAQVKKPEDIVKKKMEQPIAENESDNMEEDNNVDRDDELDDNDEENAGMQFRIQYTRPRVLGGSSSSASATGTTGESNFLAMVR